MKVNPDARESSTALSVSLRNAKKYKYYDDFAEEEITDLSAVKAGPVFSAADGSCDNFALEYHLSFTYEPLKQQNEKAATFTIKKVDVDVVYGKIIPATPDTPV